MKIACNESPHRCHPDTQAAPSQAKQQQRSYWQQHGIARCVCTIIILITIIIIVMITIVIITMLWLLSRVINGFMQGPRGQFSKRGILVGCQKWVLALWPNLVGPFKLAVDRGLF